MQRTNREGREWAKLKAEALLESFVLWERVHLTKAMFLVLYLQVRKH
jgi:hypothetical protein